MSRRFHISVDIANPADDMYTNTYLCAFRILVSLIFIFCRIRSDDGMHQIPLSNTQTSSTHFNPGAHFSSPSVHPPHVAATAINSIGFRWFFFFWRDYNLHIPFLHVGQHPSVALKSKYSPVAQSAWVTNDRQSCGLRHCTVEANGISNPRIPRVEHTTSATRIQVAKSDEYMFMCAYILYVPTATIYDCTTQVLFHMSKTSY